MPIYEYQCGGCNQIFECLHKVNETPNVICEACGKPNATRLVSAPGFQLKGTGWYVTDFKDKKPTKSEVTSQVKSDSKTETKPVKEAKATASSSGSGDS